MRDAHVSEEMSFRVSAADPIRLWQAVLPVVLMMFAACGGAPTTTAPETTATGSPPPPAPSSGTAALSWDPVTKDTNGEPLTNLAGYKIHYGASAQAMSTVEVLANPAQTTYVVTGLPPGTWYFAVGAYTTSGTESDLSNVAAKTISYSQ
jgi:hypothetical protein